MDVQEYYDTVKFSCAFKEKNCYIMEARIDTGNQFLIRVLSLNNTPRLKDMQWKKLWILDTQKANGHYPLQYFYPATRFSSEKSLRIQDSFPDVTTYSHVDQPFIVTFVNRDQDERFQREEKCTLIEAFSNSNVEVRRFE